MKLSVIIACHNRKELTLRCIELVQVAAAHADVTVSFTVFDDGSTDGTFAAISALPVSLHTLKGDGTAYWASGMAQAEAFVLQDSVDSDDEFIVWLNDDVALDKDAFSEVANTISVFPGAVIVGAMRDPNSGVVTYSGMRRAGLHPLRFEPIPPTNRPQRAQTFNGNLVVVPVAVARDLGGIDGGFSHALADIDYGLRCGRAGIPVILGPGTYGTCKRNEALRPGRPKDDWEAFVGPKGGGNYSSLRRILRKSHPGVWPLIISVTYGVWWIRRIRATLTLGLAVK